MEAGHQGGGPPQGAFSYSIRYVRITSSPVPGLEVRELNLPMLMVIFGLMFGMLYCQVVQRG